MSNIRFDKKGRVELRLGENRLRFDIGKLARLLTGKEKRDILKELRRRGKDAGGSMG